MGLVDRIILYVTNNPRMAAITWLITMVGFVVSIVSLIITIKTLKKKELSYIYETTILVKKEAIKARNITILYNDKPIDNLSVTTFYIYNSGHDQINAKEMIEGFELMVIGSVEIVSVDIERVSHLRVTREKDIKPINNARKSIELEKKDILFIKPDKEYAVVPIPFTVFQKKDFMVLKIYHTGGDDTIFRLLGTGDNLKIINRLAEKKRKEFLFSAAFGNTDMFIALFKELIQIEMTRL